MKKLLMTLMAAMLPLLAFAGDWIEMLSKDDVTYYIYSSIEDEYDEHLAWIKMTYNTPASRKVATERFEQDELVFESRVLYAFNSAWTMMNNKSITFYGAGGSVINTYTFDDLSNWSHITPDSLGEGFRNYARELYNTSNAKSSEEWSDF